ncbi:MAG: hypothetical protein AYK18_10190 [Theionarchaea archaeon DG-70]|nr:MAG: hypothetical protein AYK18_10190 [Theionarchaea archaeon DG-70]
MVGQKSNHISDESKDQQISHFADLQSDKEKCVEKRAYSSLSLGPDVDVLVTELVEIGRTCGFISTPGGNFDDNGYHIRARQIGILLDKIGGMELMQAAYYRIVAILGPVAGRTLEVAWGYIGNWWP